MNKDWKFRVITPLGNVFAEFPDEGRPFTANNVWWAYQRAIQLYGQASVVVPDADAVKVPQ